MDKTWQVRIVDDLDNAILEQAAGFLQSFLPPGEEDIWSADYFKWKLGGSNPASRGFMTVAVHGGAIIGVTSVTRKRFWDGQREVAVAEIGDTYSHIDFRKEGRSESPHFKSDDPESYLNRSIFGRLVTETRERAEKAGISLIYGAPNENSMPGYVSRLGFFHYDSHRNQYFVRPGSSGLVQQWPILRPLRVFLRALDRRHAKALQHLTSGWGRLKAQEALEIGPEIDSLWKKLSPARGFGMLRDQAYFRHRFMEHPLARMFRNKKGSSGRVEYGARSGSPPLLAG